MANSSAVTAGVNATADHYNNLRKDVLLGTNIKSTDSDASTITFDLSDITKGNWRDVTITASRILALSNVAVGQRFVLSITQGGAGSFTVTWFTTIKWSANVAPTLTTTAGKTDTFGFRCTSAGNYEGYVIGQNL
jgi:hypothetical protein